ncbi:hypothetical protein ACFXTH_001167 [Malus domestica]
MAGPSAATTGSSVLTVESNALVRLQKLLSLSASQVLEHQGLDFVGACLNDLAVDGQLSTEAITRVSSTLERTREYFGILEKALRAEDNLKAATTVQEALHLKVKVLKAKKETLADLDRQTAELQNRMLAVASELAKDFELNGKSCLTKYAASVKRVEQLKMDKRNRQAEVTMGEVRWLKLKAVLESLISSSC